MQSLNHSTKIRVFFDVTKCSFFSNHKKELEGLAENGIILIFSGIDSMILEKNEIFSKR